MTAFTDLLGQRLLMCDGAMGTMLHAAGCALDRALPEVNLSDPKLVAAIHESYVSAGADIIQTNTFGANRLWLAEHGYPDQVEEINRAAVAIAREMSERSNRVVFVAGSVSPAVTARQRRQVGAAERKDVIAEQILALTAEGVDLLILETFGYLDELAEAVQVAAGICGTPIVAQATFADDGRTLGGETPHEVASVLGELPAAMLGTNCTTGPQRMLAVVESLVRYSALPVSAQPNAGQPRKVGHRRFEFSIDATYFARYLRRFAEAGAAMVGGCCGTTPTHIEAAVASVAGLPPAGIRAGTQPRSRRPARGQAGQPGDATGILAARPAAPDFVGAAEVPAAGRQGRGVGQVGRGDQGDPAAGARDVGQGRQQQGQFADAFLADEQLGQRAPGPAAAGQPGIERGVAGRQAGQGGRAPAVAAPETWMLEEGFAHVPFGRIRPTAMPSITSSSPSGSGTMGLKSGFSGRSSRRLPRSHRRLTVTSPPMRATTTWPERASRVACTASQSPSRMPASFMDRP